MRIALSTFGRLDVFFANAGMLVPYTPISEETEDSFMRSLQVNTFGVFLGIKYAAEAMKITGGGSIICTASIAAIRADLTSMQYAASKGAVLSMVTAANDRLLLDNVRVNGILPGGVPTDLMMSVPKKLHEMGLEMRGYDIARFPPIDSTEIAKLVTFLASDDSIAIKGHALVIDGGMSQSMGSQPYPVPIRKKKQM